MWFLLAENPGSSAVNVNVLLCINSNKKLFFDVYSEENYGHVCVHIIQCFNLSWISTTLSTLSEKVYFVYLKYQMSLPWTPSTHEAEV